MCVFFFFFKQKTAYEVSACLVGSEMCIRDRWWTTQKQCEIIDECLQFFGGYGYMMEYPIAKMYADSRIQKIYGGSNEIMKMLIARAI